MRENMDKIITVGLIIIGVVCAWAVLTANHLYVG
jgi:hypothetical protein